mgnify:FL=1
MGGRLARRAALAGLLVAGATGAAMGLDRPEPDAPASPPAAIAASPAQAGALLAALHAEGHLGGAAVIRHGDRILFAGAAGQADRGRPFAVDTAGDGASIAKTVTAALVWRLVAAGRIGLADPVQRHVAEFPCPEVRVGDLLAHGIELPDYAAFEPLVAAGQPVDNAGLLRLIPQIAPRLPHPPGERYTYCNVCYDTLALLAERVTSRPYAQLAVDDLLSPAGARDAFLRPAHFRDWPGPRTVGFRSARPDAEPFDSFDAEAFYGGSNIQLSAADLAAWGQAWASGGVLAGPIRRQALAPAIIGDRPSAMSLAGWYCADAGVRCYYTGHHQGFFSFVWWDAPRGLSVGLMTNSALPFPLQVWLMRALVALAEGRAPDPRPSLAPADARFDAGRAAGRWRLPGVGTLRLWLQDGETWTQLEGRPATQAYAVGHATLFVPGLGAYLALAPADAGRTRLAYATPFVAARGEWLGR